MKMRLLVLVLAALAAASNCVAQDDARPAAEFMRMNYPEFGFDVAVPRSSIRTSSTTSAPGTMTDAFYCGQLVLVIAVVKPDNNQAPAAAIEELFANGAQKMNLGRTTCQTKQGLEFVGAGGVITIKDEIARIHPLARKLTEEAKKANPLVEQLFAGKTPISLWLFATPLPGYQSQVLMVCAGGPPDSPSQVDSLARSAAESVKSARLASTSQSPDNNLGLSPGHIAVYGGVKSIDDKAKSLVMMADKVVVYGQNPAELDPAREKTVVFTDLPKDVAAGSRIIVIGKNTGTGKPMNADLIKLESTKSVSK